MSGTRRTGAVFAISGPQMFASVTVDGDNDGDDGQFLSFTLEGS